VYPFTVTATDGAISQQLHLTLNVADFTIGMTPSAATLLTGDSTNLTLTIGAVGAWTELVNISCQVSPTIQVGCYNTVGTFNIGTFQVPFSAYSAPPGDYTVTVTGSADGVIHSSSPVTIHVQGATGAVSPTQQTINAGSSAQFNVSLNSQNSLGGQFSFSCPGLPSNVSCSFNPSSGTLAANGSLTSILTVSVSAKTGSVPAWQGMDGRGKSIIIRSLLLILLLLTCCVPSSVIRNRRHLGSARTALMASIVMLLMIGMMACGGGSSGSGGGGGSGPPPPPPPPPPPQTVVVSVQAASAAVTVQVGNITIQIPQ
jgi:hypothetical protein